MRNKVIFGLVMVLVISGMLGVVSSEIDAKICEVDDDCKFEVPSKLLECSYCDPYNCNSYNFENNDVVAINKIWSPNCPPDPIQDRNCIACVGGISGNFTLYKAKCINNQCTKVRGEDVLISDAGVEYDSKITEYFNDQTLVEQIILEEGDDSPYLGIINNDIWIRVVINLKDISYKDSLFFTFSDKEIREIHKSEISEKITAKITKEGFDKLIQDEGVELVKLPMRGYFVEEDNFQFNELYIYLGIILIILIIIIYYLIKKRKFK